MTADQKSRPIPSCDVTAAKAEEQYRVYLELLGLGNLGCEGQRASIFSLTLRVTARERSSHTMESCSREIVTSLTLKMSGNGVKG